MKGCGCPAEEFGLCPEDSGATEDGTLGSQLDVLGKREESCSPLKNRASGHSHEIRVGEVVLGSFLSPLELTLRKGTLSWALGPLLNDVPDMEFASAWCCGI